MHHRIAIVLFVLALGCSNKERDRYYWQHDPSAGFQTTRTYAMEQNDEPSVGANVRQVIDQEIQKQMANKGLTRAEPGRQADIVIRYFGDPEHTAMMGAPPPAMREVGRDRAPSPSVLIPLDPSTSHNRPPEHAA